MASNIRDPSIFRERQPTSSGQGCRDDKGLGSR